MDWQLVVLRAEKENAQKEKFFYSLTFYRTFGAPMKWKNQV
jgi:hypothetical protein